jgi:hypothetical protein
MQVPRMTTRRWLVVVAVAAAVFYGERAREHWRLCELRADQHAGEEKYERFRARPDYPDFVCGIVTPESEAEEQQAREVRSAIRHDAALERAAYHSQLKKKFERAAWRPWEPVPPDAFDPPEP